MNIIDNIVSFNDKYKVCCDSLDFRKKDAETSAYNKMCIMDFLKIALIDCYVPYPIYKYGEVIVDEYLSFFKRIHNKDDFNKLLAIVNRKLQD